MLGYQKIILMIMSVLIFEGCNFDLNIESPYTINEAFVENQHYVGIEGIDAVPYPGLSIPLPRLLTIHYETLPSEVLLFLNGESMADKMVLHDDHATLDLDAVSGFLIQGENAITIDPLRFGPSLNFSFDNAGPRVVIEQVTCSDGNCADGIGGTVTLKIKAIDASGINDVNLKSYEYAFDGAIESDAGNEGFSTGSKGLSYVENIDATFDSDDGLWHLTFEEQAFYSFTAEDEYGFIAQTSFLTEEQEINPSFKMRIGKSVLESVVPLMRPLLEEAKMIATETLRSAGKNPEDFPDAEHSKSLDEMGEWWKGNSPTMHACAMEIFGFCMTWVGEGNKDKNNPIPSECGHIDVSRPDPTDPTDYLGKVEGVTRNGDGSWNIPAEIDHAPGSCSAVNIYYMQLDQVPHMAVTLKAGNKLSLDMQLKDGDDDDSEAMNLKMGVRYFKCGGKSDKGYCYDDGEVKAAGIVGLGNMNITATAVNPKGDIIVDIQDGELNLGHSDLNLGMSGLGIGSDLDWMLGMLGGMLDSMFVDIVMQVLSQNIEDFKIAFDVKPLNGALDSEVSMVARAYQVRTEASPSDGEIEWLMNYSGFLKAAKAHAEIPPILGSYYEEGEVLPVPKDNNPESDDNFSIAINVNT
ncbi:MAG: hypothetical protein HRU20_12915, partial [Pseudomonadales bacterium]|nr:hypothetical protein [Pseudomonadales bacterium]